MRKLPNDTSRCSNARCPLKEKCLRWTDRRYGIVLPLSMFEFKDGKCKHLIEK